MVNKGYRNSGIKFATLLFPLQQIPNKFDLVFGLHYLCTKHKPRTMKEKLIGIWQRFRSKVPLVGLFALLYVLFILFIDEYSFLNKIIYDREINRLKKEIKAENDSIQYYRTQILEMKTDPESLEKMAREKYRMQRPDEDVYTIVEIPTEK